ncbi:hypothetical protein TRFO_26539 [Tritrichomonas foetus]|uniref:DUF3447 domain-containing protein n=1 Tax=Tritrichomonas foetus TaxID=1144522 RepID=A0A1J4K388_9EUKA|nr:hypothetical protein TRFO_26539 [Tritrichomonas foetus]|eukprot:OHT05651.1 hypothetical protein TRFO_26539 [Tritrichomonas foetus]
MMNSPEIESLIHLQNKIFDINPDNFEETKKLILESSFINCSYDLEIILITIHRAIKTRLKYPKCYISLIASLKKYIQQFYTSVELYQLFSVEQCSQFFCFKLYEMNIIELKDIFPDIQTYSDFLYYFLPEVKNSYPGFYEESLDKCSDALLEKINSIPPNFDYQRQNPFNTHPLIQFIINDDLDQFLELYSKYDKHDFTINISPFEISDFYYKVKQMPPIYYAALYGSLQVFKFLFINTGRYDENLMKMAILGGNCEIISLVERQITFNFKEMIELAIIIHRNDIVHYLLVNYGLTYNQLSPNYLFHSLNSEIIFEYLKSVEEEKNNKIDKNIEHEFTPISLFEQIKFGNLLTVRYMYKLFPNLFVPFLDNLHGKTQLHCACESRSVQMVKYIYNQNPNDLNAKDDHDETPICSAMNWIATFIFLCELDKIDLNVTYQDGETLFNVAKMYHSSTIFPILLSKVTTKK